MKATTADKNRLQTLEEHIYNIVSDVRAYVTSTEATELYRLRDLTGSQYDAANRKWSDWTPED